MKPKLDWESQIREKGLRATKAAVLVLKTLQQIKRPLSHDELLERLNQSSSIDTVTLYRVLDRFTQTSLIERMNSLNATPATNTFSFPVALLCQFS